MHARWLVFFWVWLHKILAHTYRKKCDCNFGMVAPVLSNVMLNLPKKIMPFIVSLIRIPRHSVAALLLETRVLLFLRACGLLFLRASIAVFQVSTRVTDPPSTRVRVLLFFRRHQCNVDVFGILKSDQANRAKNYMHVYALLHSNLVGVATSHVSNHKALLGFCWKVAVLASHPLRVMWTIMTAATITLWQPN